MPESNNTVKLKSTPVLLDRAIQGLQQTLLANLPWLDKAYGRGYKMVQRLDNGTKYVYPAAYIGGSEYVSLTPNDNIGNFCWFDIYDPQVITAQIPAFPTHIYKGALVFWLNLQTVYQTDEFINSEEIKSEILSIITTPGAIASGIGRVAVTEVVEGIDSIYKGYTLEHVYSMRNYAEEDLQSLDKQFFMFPYYGVRFEFEITIRETCPVKKDIILPPISKDVEFTEDGEYLVKADKPGVLLDQVKVTVNTGSSGSAGIQLLDVRTPSHGMWDWGLRDFFYNWIEHRGFCYNWNYEREWYESSEMQSCRAKADYITFNIACNGKYLFDNKDNIYLGIQRYRGIKSNSYLRPNSNRFSLFNDTFTDEPIVNFDGTELKLKLYCWRMPIGEFDDSGILGYTYFYSPYDTKDEAYTNDMYTHHLYWIDTNDIGPSALSGFHAPDGIAGNKANILNDVYDIGASPDDMNYNIIDMERYPEGDLTKYKIMSRDMRYQLRCCTEEIEAIQIFTDWAWHYPYVLLNPGGGGGISGENGGFIQPPYYYGDYPVTPIKLSDCELMDDADGTLAPFSDKPLDWFEGKTRFTLQLPKPYDTHYLACRFFKKANGYDYSANANSTYYHKRWGPLSFYGDIGNRRPIGHMKKVRVYNPPDFRWAFRLRFALYTAEQIKHHEEPIAPGLDRKLYLTTNSGTTSTLRITIL